MVRSEKHIFRNAGTRFAIGLTLVELLVVLAMIAILFALLLPTMTKIRQAASTVVCVARMSQLNMATVVFVTDHQGRFPPVFAGSSQSYTSGGATYTFPWGWPKAIFPTDVSTPQKALATGYLTKYLASGMPDYKLYLCPLLERGLVPSPQGNRSYLYNRYLGGAPSNWFDLPGASLWWRDCNPYKLSAVGGPSTMAVFVCTATVSSGIGSGGNALWFRETPAAEQAPYGSPNCYHLPDHSITLHQGMVTGGTYNVGGGQVPKYRGFVNAAFVDGSVRSIPWTVDRSPVKAIEGLRVRPEQLGWTW